MTNNNKINEKECNETIHPVDRYVQQHRSNSSEGLPRSVVDQAESNLCVRSSRERRGRNDPSPVRRHIPQDRQKIANSYEEDVCAQSL